MGRGIDPASHPTHDCKPRSGQIPSKLFRRGDSVSGWTSRSDDGNHQRLQQFDPAASKQHHGWIIDFTQSLRVLRRRDWNDDRPEFCQLVLLVRSVLKSAAA